MPSSVPFSESNLSEEILTRFSTLVALQPRVSSIYELCTCPLLPQKHISMTTWELSLHFSATPLQWCSATCLLSSIQDVFNIGNPCNGCSPQCWINCSQTGSISHIWWFCSHITNFQTSVFSLAPSITKSSLIRDSKLSLLGSGMNCWPSKFHTVQTHLFIAAKLMLVRNWKQATTSEFSNTIHILNDHALFELFELMLAKAHRLLDKFITHWSPWISHPSCNMPLT